MIKGLFEPEEALRVWEMLLPRAPSGPHALLLRSGNNRGPGVVKITEGLPGGGRRLYDPKETIQWLLDRQPEEVREACVDAGIADVQWIIEQVSNGER